MMMLDKYCRYYFQLPMKKVKTCSGGGFLVGVIVRSLSRTQCGELLWRSGQKAGLGIVHQ
jgi:hypothetical protein